MKKNKITGLIGTAVLHILLLILLLVIAIRRPQVQEEGGVPVMLGKGIGFLGETFGSEWKLSESKVLDGGVICSTYQFDKNLQ